MFMGLTDRDGGGDFSAVIDCIMAVAEDFPEKGRKRKKAVGPYGDIQDRKCQKVRGEIAEAMFLAKAARMGYGLATPWGDSLKYDMIVDTGGKLSRVQVKSAHRVSASKGGGYHVRACSRNRRRLPSRGHRYAGGLCDAAGCLVHFSSQGVCADEVDAVVSEAGEEEIEV